MKSLHKNVCLAEKKDGFDFIYDREISSAKQTKRGCKNSVRVFYSPFCCFYVSGHSDQVRLPGFSAALAAVAFQLEGR